MNGREFIKDYLTFTRKERIAILVILFVVLIVALLPKILSSSARPQSINTDTSWMSAIKKLERKEPESPVTDNGQDNDEEFAYQYDSSITHRTYQKPELFYFDPNILSSEGWKKLGLKEKNIQTILNYLNKGGHFYKAEDLQKIYGLHKQDYERLAPYVRITKPNDTKTELANISSSGQQESNSDQKNFHHYSIIDINTADSSAFIALPGIGSKLAARILNFREKLGGFYSIDQIGETYGLPDSTFKKIRQYLEVKNSSLRKININSATIDELKSHPYIKWSLANPLVAYRNEHGPFPSVDDIKKIPSVTDEIFRKIAPYLIAQ